MFQFSSHSVYEVIAVLLPGALFSLVQSKQETLHLLKAHLQKASDRGKKTYE